MDDRLFFLYRNYFHVAHVVMYNQLPSIFDKSTAQTPVSRSK